MSTVPAINDQEDEPTAPGPLTERAVEGKKIGQGSDIEMTLKRTKSLQLE